jgi:hypothetical protein
MQKVHDGHKRVCEERKLKSSVDKKLVLMAIGAGVVWSILLVSFFFADWPEKEGANVESVSSISPVLLLLAMAVYVLAPDVHPFFSGNYKRATLRVVIRFFSFVLGVLLGTVATLFGIAIFTL